MSTKEDKAIEDAVKALQSDLGEVSKKLKEISSTADSKVQESKEKLTAQVENHPLTTLSIAAGVGFLVGLLFKK